MRRGKLLGDDITRRGFLSGSGLVFTRAMLEATSPADGQQKTADVAKSDASEALASLVWDLVEANRILADQNVLDGYGHVSVRSEQNPARYLLARSMAPEITTADDIMEFGS